MFYDNRAGLEIAPQEVGVPLGIATKKIPCHLTELHHVAKALFGRGLGGEPPLHAITDFELFGRVVHGREIIFPSVSVSKVAVEFVEFRSRLGRMTVVATKLGTRTFAVMAATIVAAIVMGGAAAARGATYCVSQASAAAADANPGSEAKPWKTLSRAAGVVEPGDTVLIDSGVYREQLKLDKSGFADRPIRFAALPGAQVVLSGADRVTGWKPDDASAVSADGGRIYVVDWPYSFIGWSPHNAHPDDDEHRLIGRAEQVFVFGYPLRQVLDKSKLARGTFFVDLLAKRLYAESTDNRDLSEPDALVEASSRDVVLDCAGAFVTVRGIRIRYAANRAQEGAAIFRGERDVVENCLFEWTNGAGATFLGPDQVVRDCTFSENGQLGFGANRAHRLLVTGCQIRGNNAKGFSRGWEAGGDKLVLCRGAVLDHCVFADNRGNGIWFDIGNEDCQVRNCLIEDNEDAGIFDEISFGLKAHDNVIVGNGFAGTPGSWGAAAGICLSSSPGSIIERNLIIGNKEGFNFREQNRTTPRIDGQGRHGEEPVWNHDQIVRNNVLAYNRDAQVWGWFDVADSRAWPRSIAATRPAEPRGASTDLAAGYQAKREAGPPPGTDLKGLHLEFDGNLYAVRPGQGLFNWGAAWRRQVNYATLDDLRRELGFEPTGRIAELTFHDELARDFRVARDSPAIGMGCYPQGAVPLVILGTDP